MGGPEPSLHRESTDSLILFVHVIPLREPSAFTHDPPSFPVVKAEQLEAAREFVTGQDVFVSILTGSGKSAWATGLSR